MNLNIFNGLPEYVRITILSQIRRLLSTPLFNYEDKEDLTQDLLLFYLKRFYTVPNPDEALVVHALKQYATNLLVKRYLRRDFLHSSSANYTDEEFSYFKSEEPDISNQAVLAKVWKIASDKEKVVIQKILQGNSIDQISRDLHISKKTIYKFFEKVRKKLK
ncbi:MAG: LuxR C-terminal-related transcriptional regulator [Acetobacter sp.]|nr:LuxR C-terminal-related transcriptional regulator [Acetobacter sp.]